LSGDFRQHVIGYLLAELIELHDRDRFEVIGVSFGIDDRSDIRARLVGAFDRFIDVIAVSDAEVAKLVRDSDVDIAVDLMAHTRDARMRIFAHRPAPIQVNYFGYAGTMGAAFFDYIVGDRIVLPFEHAPYYSEHIVQLPEGFFANDSRRVIAPQMPTRSAAGLPERGFVFCCFNNSVKIQPAIFDVSMRLLRTVPASGRWLSLRNPSARDNLVREAAARGVEGERLVFAQHAPRIEDHLARHRLADLFLDTMPYNAHATAADALWAGLPVLTCAGNAFASRVGASLLHAVGLPELVTQNLADYEALALRLASDAALLAGIRQKLARNRRSEPLFNTSRLRRHLEAAYTTMWNRYQNGERPRAFAVPTLEPSASDAEFAATIGV